MPTVQSVTGPLRPQELGLTLPHEHVYINMTRTTPQDGYLNVADEMAAELALFAEAGGSTLIDMTNGELSDYAAPVGWSDELRVMQQNPATGSRSIANVLATKEMAERTGVQVILGTGHYYSTYLDQQWFDRTSTNTIADFLVADLVDEIPGTGVRAGVIGEIASDLSHITATEERSFRAAARASVETGAMVSTHAATFPTGLAQLEIMVEEGVDPSRVVIGHADTVKSVDYSLELLRRGAFVEFDCLMTCRIGGEVIRHQVDRRLSYLKTIIAAGYADRVLLSQDVCQRSHLRALGGPGYVFLFREFRELALHAGIDPDVLDAIHRDNPRRAVFGE
ncbi:phosphotriesterase [Microbacterium trichothecenolyticum]|uniref:phosphotriesterase family protein n=1 Tax=Microbacterium trichothecenolyticum TaxID=69370 RepID=UPI0035BE7A2A